MAAIIWIAALARVGDAAVAHGIAALPDRTNLGRAVISSISGRVYVQTADVTGIGTGACPSGPACAGIDAGLILAEQTGPAGLSPRMSAVVDYAGARTIIYLSVRAGARTSRRAAWRRARGAVGTPMVIGGCACKTGGSDLAPCATTVRRIMGHVGGIGRRRSRALTRFVDARFFQVRPVVRTGLGAGVSAIVGHALFALANLGRAAGLGPGMHTVIGHADVSLADIARPAGL